MYKRQGIDFVVDEPAIEGEEDLLNELNAESGLNINNNGETKMQELVECAACLLYTSRCV